MDIHSKRIRILEMIENGEISPDEGAHRLDTLNLEDEATEEKPLDRMQVLELIERGEISAEEGMKRFQEEAGAPEEPEVVVEPGSPRRISDEELRKWKQWWTIPLWAGLGIVVLSGLWMNAAYQATGTGFWFFCSWLPMALGILLIVIAGQSRGGRWLHVRVKQAPGNTPRNIAISFPLPVRFTAWALRNFGHFVPPLNRTNIDELIQALDKHTQDTPLYVQVDEGENGEQVEVFIG